MQAVTERLSRGVSFGGQEYPMRQNLYGYGQTPAIPDVPKPPIPGYKTDEACTAMLTEQKASIDKEMKSKHIMLGVGGLLIGWGIGYVVGKGRKGY
jgi:hypothetical protein